MNLSLPTCLLLFTTAVTLHMLEEILWLPAWSQTAGRWHEPVTNRAFNIATAVMLAFLYLIAFLASSAPPQQFSIYLVAGLALLMIINLFIPHLGATINMRRYSPGLATSLLLVVPTALLLLRSAFAAQLITMPSFLLISIPFLIAAALIWPALFRIGKRSTRF